MRKMLSYISYEYKWYISYAQQFSSEFELNGHIYTRQIKNRDARIEWSNDCAKLLLSVRKVKDQISPFTPQQVDKPLFIDHALIMFTSKDEKTVEFYTATTFGAETGKMLIVKSNLFSIYFQSLRVSSERHVIRQPELSEKIGEVINYFYKSSRQTGDCYYSEWYTYDVLGYNHSHATINVPSTRELLINIRYIVSVWDWERLDEEKATPTPCMYVNKEKSLWEVIENWKEQDRLYQLKYCQFDGDDMEDFLDDDNSY
jgi:hypothetical protein